MKNNKLLAEYLGFTLFPDGIYISDAPGFENYFESIQRRWNPKTDWNQLMMVVDKIEAANIWIEVKIAQNVCSIEHGDHTEVMPNYGGCTKIEAVYNACVEYIKTKNHENN